jgi:hypothetical protein
MDNLYSEVPPSQVESSIHWGHFGAVMMVMVLVLGMSWMEKPELFSFKKSSSSDANAPHYYAYIPPASDQQPQVLGANTNPTGPSIINDDGTVSPVDMGEVLAASTQDVQLSPEQIKVNQIPDSTQAIQKYLADSKAIENGAIDNSDFEIALSSGNQNLINKQAEKLIAVQGGLLKLSVPQGLVKFHQLTVIQYSSAVGVLQNFTQADSNPELVGQYLGQFLKSQQDLDTETSAIAQKYNLDPVQFGSVMDAAAAPQSLPSIDSQNLGLSGSQSNGLNFNAPQ